jgi:citrate lyase subunit beta / citryl-CoA lyase
VWWVDTLLTQIDHKLRRESRIALEVLIEDVEAMVNVTEIAHSSPRLEALIFGPGDYSASQGVDIAAIGAANSTYPGDVWHYARNQIIVAARAAGLAMIDGLFAGITDPDGYRRESSVIPVDGSASSSAP